MKKNKLPINFEGIKGNKTLDSLFDNQLLYSCIDAKFADTIAKSTLLRKPKVLTMFNQLIEVNKVVLLDFYINNSRFSDEFMVVPNLQEAVFFGATTIRKWRIQLDFETNSIDAKPVQLRI